MPGVRRRKDGTPSGRQENQKKVKVRQSAPQGLRSSGDPLQWQDDFIIFRVKTVFLAFLAVRLISGVYNLISDCDETFNYWEPSHYLLYGYGLQTWEYSPVYALRPYLYVAIHSTIGKLFLLAGIDDKIVIFLLIRCVLGAFCAWCESIFYRGVTRKFGGRIGLFSFIFLLFSAGMYHSSTAHLPSTFSMYGVLLSFGLWFSQNSFLSVVAACFGVILGWPFVAVLFAPLGLDILVRHKVIKPLIWGMLGLALFLVPSVLVDDYYYGKPVIAVWNLIRYNVFDPHPGSELYGVEEWPFYFINLFLNFNVTFALSLFALPFALLFRKWSRHLTHLKSLSIICYLSPYYLWLAAMLRLPHKEERFLFVMYPLVCLGGAISLVLCLDVLRVFFGALVPRSANTNGLRKFVMILGIVFCSIFIALSASRIAALRMNYDAPLHVYEHLYRHELKEGHDPYHPIPGDVNVCVGKEWYRFPSNFWLPGQRFHLQFIRSSFRGELPKPYASPPNGTRIIPTDMNDQNMEELSRYVQEDDCHYLVDLDFEAQSEPHYAKDQEKWQVVFYRPFIDAARSSPLFRAFYVPHFTEKRTEWNNYYLLKSRTHF